MKQRETNDYNLILRDIERTFAKRPEPSTG